MWNTTLGCRILTGPEARLISNAALRLVDDLRNFIPHNANNDWRPNFGISIVDRLRPEQQIVMIDQVIGYLLDPVLGPPKPSALLDATVAAIYAQAFAEIEVELDDQRMASLAEEGDTDVRKSVVAALMQPLEELESEPPNYVDPECCEAETWMMCISSLRDRVLADEDWQMGELTLDLPVDSSTDLKQTMGIHRDYFVCVPPDPTITETRQAWADLNFKISGERVSPVRFGDRPFKVVKLSDVTEAMEMQSDEWCSYVNTLTGKVVTVPSESIESFEAADAEDGDQPIGDDTDGMLEEARQIVEEEHHVPLPSKFEINEWEIMRDFCNSRGIQDEREQLLESIHGSGAFRFFRSTLERLQLRDDWFRFRNSALEAIAINWMDDNEICWMPDDEYRSIFGGQLDVDF